MAYIHNQQQIKLDECDVRKQKEMFMKYGYGCPGNKYVCEDIDGVEEDIKKAAKVIDEKYSTLYPILDEARKIITGNRKDDYGTAEDSFKRIADYWNAYLCHKRDKVDASAHEEDLPYEFLRGVYLTAKDVAMMMVLFKIAREEHSHKHDNLTDMIGYTALANKMEE